ncbi:MAG: ubiquinone/menaquinone biosynthesis methyltransferase [Fimbriimonadaceae bacterium]
MKGTTIDPIEQKNAPVWELQGERKREGVRQLFSEIAPTYDRFNDLNSAGSHHKWRKEAVAMLELKGDERALDLCCGTGDFVRALSPALPESQIVGTDNCAPMLDLARQKFPGVQFEEGDACELPFDDQSFDVVTVGWGIRNTYDIDLAHREIFRVLQPGGRFVSVDMALPKSGVIRFGRNLYSRWMIPFFGSLLRKPAEYTYLGESTDRFLSREELAASMQKAGFERVRWKDLYLGNICIHLGAKS